MNKIVLGDSLTVLPQLSPNSVDLICTSPPYFRKRVTEGLGIESDLDIYLDSLIAITKECERILKPTGSLVVNLGDKYMNGLCLVPHQYAIRVIRETNLFMVNEISWVKKNPLPRFSPRRLNSAFEPIYHFAKTKEYKYFPERFVKSTSSKKAGTRKGQGYLAQIEVSTLSEAQKEKARNALSNALSKVKCGDITDFRMKIAGVHALPYGGFEGGRMKQLRSDGFYIIEMYGRSILNDVLSTSIGKGRSVKHHSVYPNEVPEFFITLLTEEGDLVLDPFAGSGTTLVVAKNNGRKYMGIEINPVFHSIATDLTK